MLTDIRNIVTLLLAVAIFQCVMLATSLVLNVVLVIRSLRK